MAGIGCRSAVLASEALSSRRAIEVVIEIRGDIVVCGEVSDYGAAAMGAMSSIGKYSKEEVLEVRSRSEGEQPTMRAVQKGTKSEWCQTGFA